MLFDSPLDITQFSSVQWERSTCHYLYKRKPQHQNKQGFKPHQFRQDYCVKQQLDEKLRISDVTFVEIQDQQTHQIQKWRMVRYVNGHFNQHVDNQVDPKQIGNDILLPPKTQCSYEGGALKLIQDGKEVRYLPHETKWTRVFIPLGVRHCVQPVKGTRISFVKIVLGNKEFKYQYPEGVEVSGQPSSPNPYPYPDPIGPIGPVD